MLIKQIALWTRLQVKWLVSKLEGVDNYFLTKPKVAQQHCVAKARQGRNPDVRLFDRLLGLFCAFVCGAVCSPKMHVITKDFCLGVLTSSLQNGSLIPVDGFREHGFTGFASHDPVCQKFFSSSCAIGSCRIWPPKNWFRMVQAQQCQTQLCHTHTALSRRTLSHTTCKHNFVAYHSHTLDKNGSL
jgi:hypothetical protein